MKKTFALFGILSLFVLFGCGTSYLKDSTNVSKQKKSFEKILVVAKSKDKLARIKFEDQVVSDFATNDVTAVSSISIINTDKISKEISEAEIEEIKKSLINDGFDGVIITNLIDTSQYSDVESGNLNTAYVPLRYGRFGRYYRTYPVSYWEPDQIDVGIKYTLESCLYVLSNTAEDNLQWVGRFQVKDPSSLVKSIEIYSKELTEALLKENISTN